MPIKVPDKPNPIIFKTVYFWRIFCSTVSTMIIVVILAADDTPNPSINIPKAVIYIVKLHAKISTPAKFKKQLIITAGRLPQLSESFPKRYNPKICDVKIIDLIKLIVNYLSQRNGPNYVEMDYSSFQFKQRCHYEEFLLQTKG